MMHTRRGMLSAAQRAEVWNRWKPGQSLHAIGRALGKNHVVIRFLLTRHGGIAPPVRGRSPVALTPAERETSPAGSLPANGLGTSPRVCSAPCRW